MKYILAIDQGTTGTTSALINSQTFEFIDKVNQEFPQIFPKPGQVEHNLNDIWATVEKTTNKVLAKNNVTPDQIQCIGITNQRETTCAFTHDGVPLANAIVWQDRRTSSRCSEMKNSGHEEKVRIKTGLPIDPYFSGSKMEWLLKNNDNVKKAASENNLRLGTIDAFLLYKLTGSKSFFTEPSNASRTLLMNLKTTNWDDELLTLFSIKKEYLPKIQDSAFPFGKTFGLNFIPDGIPITGILGDQQSALFGQAGYAKGQMKCTYGTGAFILLNTGPEIVPSKSGLLSTVAYKIAGQTTYALEGSCYIAGAAVQWLRDNLKLFKESAKVEELARLVKDLNEMEHILFLPFFTGIGSPYWKPDVKAAIIGLTRDTNNTHISRACLDGIALSINDLIDAMKADTGLTISSLKVDGGAVENHLLMEIQATISGTKIIKPKVIETTAYGAALAAAIGNQQLAFADIDDLWKQDVSFKANPNQLSFYTKKKAQWSQYIQKMTDNM